MSLIVAGSAQFLLPVLVVVFFSLFQANTNGLASPLGLFKRQQFAPRASGTARANRGSP